MCEEGAETPCSLHILIDRLLPGEVGDLLPGDPGVLPLSVSPGLVDATEARGDRLSELFVLPAERSVLLRHQRALPRPIRTPYVAELLEGHGSDLVVIHPRQDLETSVLEPVVQHLARDLWIERLDVFEDRLAIA